MKYQIIALTLLAIVLSHNAQANDAAKNLFTNYIQLSDTFDPAVANLYADNAKIHVYRKYPHGTERAMELSGAQWKQLLIRAMPLAKAQNDKSIFSNIAITKYNKGYKIKANRYSNRKCYTDSGYYMVVALNTSGKLIIIEEYSETQPQSDC